MTHAFFFVVIRTKREQAAGGHGFFETIGAVLSGGHPSPSDPRHLWQPAQAPAPVPVAVPVPRPTTPALRFVSQNPARLTAEDFAMVAEEYSLQPAHLIAIAKTETNGRRYLADGRPRAFRVLRVP